MGRPRRRPATFLVAVLFLGLFGLTGLAGAQVGVGEVEVSAFPVPDGFASGAPLTEDPTPGTGPPPVELVDPEPGSGGTSLPVFLVIGLVGSVAVAAAVGGVAFVVARRARSAD